MPLMSGTRKIKNRSGAALSMIATLIFLVVLTVTIIFLTVYIGLMQIKGTAGGIASLSAEIKSEYSDERSLLYLTDEYGNKLTDLIGQALLYTPNPEIIVTGDITGTGISAYAIDNSAYACAPGNIGGTYDSTYAVSRVDLNRYLRCYVIPNKLGRMYGSKEKYCLFAVYDEKGPDQRNTTFGNDTLSYIPGCGGGQIVSADMAPPPGYTKRITLRLEKA